MLDQVFAVSGLFWTEIVAVSFGFFKHLPAVDP